MLHFFIKMIVGNNFGIPVISVAFSLLLLKFKFIFVRAKTHRLIFQVLELKM